MQHQLLLKYYGEVLPYLEVQKQQTEEDITDTIEMPNVIGLSITEAKKVLKEIGLEFEIVEEETEESIVVDQLPKKGIQINSNAKATLYIQ